MHAGLQSGVSESYYSIFEIPLFTVRMNERMSCLEACSKIVISTFEGIYKGAAD